MIGKKYLYKIYDINGVYLTTWNDASVPSFSYKINSGFSELVVTLARPFNNFGEGGDVNIGNQLKLFVEDVDSPTGKQIYSGELSKYQMTMAEKESVQVTFIGYVNQLGRRIVLDGIDTTVNYNQQDPSDVIKNVLDLVDSKITYDTVSIDDTGLSVTYSVIQNTAYEAVNAMIGIIPNDWYWYVDENDKFQLHQFDKTQITKLYIGKHINKLDLVKSGESICNRYYFLGGGDPQLYRRFERSTSQDTYGRRDTREQDERVTVQATAQKRALSYLDKYDHPQMEVTCTVIDSNVNSANGIDIDNLHPGQAVQIFHPTIDFQSNEPKWDDDDTLFDVDYWDNAITSAIGQVMRIEEIQYLGSGATLKLGILLPDASAYISKNTIQLETFRGKDSPATPLY